MHPTLYGNKDVTPDTFVFSIFGWLTRGPLRTLSVARPDIADGSPGLLYILYLIAADFMGADVTFPQYHGSSFHSQEFMTMNPLVDRYIEPGRPGSYISTIRDIRQYMNVYATIQRVKAGNEFKVYHILALVYDFMFFCAQMYRAVLEHRSATIDNLAAARTLVFESLQRMDLETDDNIIWYDITRCLRAVAAEVALTPLPDENVRIHPLNTPNRYRRTREDFEVLSPALQITYPPPSLADAN
jgi:hypothetical protein